MKLSLEQRNAFESNVFESQNSENSFIIISFEDLFIDIRKYLELI